MKKHFISKSQNQFGTPHSQSIKQQSLYPSQNIYGSSNLFRLVRSTSRPLLQNGNGLSNKQNQTQQQSKTPLAKNNISQINMDQQSILSSKTPNSTQNINSQTNKIVLNNNYEQNKENLECLPSQKQMQISEEIQEEKSITTHKLNSRILPILQNRNNNATFSKIKPQSVKSTERSKKICSFSDSFRSSNDGEEDLDSQQKNKKDINKLISGCQNHPSKKGKYEVEIEGEIKNYCSKCAISLARQGNQVIESEILIKKNEIERFIERLDEMIPVQLNIQDSVLKKKEDVIKFYENQVQKTEEFFNLVQIKLIEYRKNAIKKIENQRLEVDQLYQKKLAEIKEDLFESDKMKQDINKNYERIIKSIKLDPFSEIMNLYFCKIDSLSSKNEELKNIYFSVLKLDKKPDEIVKKLNAEIEIFLQNNLIYKDLSTALIKKGTSKGQLSNTVLSKKSCEKSLHRSQNYINPSITEFANTFFSTNDSLFNSTQNKLKNSLYISFENKDLFEKNSSTGKKCDPSQIDSISSKKIDEILTKCQNSENTQKSSEILNPTQIMFNSTQLLNPLVKPPTQTNNNIPKVLKYTTPKQFMIDFTKQCDLNSSNTINTSYNQNNYNNNLSYSKINLNQSDVNQTMLSQDLMTSQQNLKENLNLTEKFDDLAPSDTINIQNLPRKTRSPYRPLQRINSGNMNSSKKLNNFNDTNNNSTNSSIKFKQVASSTQKYMEILDKITVNQTKTNQYYTDVIKRYSQEEEQQNKSSQALDTQQQQQQPYKFLSSQQVIKTEESPLQTKTDEQQNSNQECILEEQFQANIPYLFKFSKNSDSDQNFNLANENSQNGQFQQNNSQQGSPSFKNNEE